MAAAIFMAMSRTILRSMIIGKPSPREAVARKRNHHRRWTLRHVRDRVPWSAQSERWEIFLRECRTQPANALRAKRRKLSELKAHNLALGIMTGVAFDEHETTLEPGDVLLMYTDGITEAINAQEEDFGVERLADLVIENAHKPADEMINEIKQGVINFAGDGAQFDDLTMVAVKRLETPHKDARSQ
jgi:sigma-B regulation protein RsbU (phosphoserine phosphatase)